MKFAIMFTMKTSVNPETIAQAVARRAEWKFPEGVELLQEYWAPNANPAVIQFVEADDAASLMFCVTPWSDVFDAEVFPVEEGSTGLKKFQSYLQGR